MTNNLQSELISLGFNENEARIYLASLEIGQSSVSSISKKAGLNRTTGYEILERLSIQGLINQTLSKSKKKLFSATSPTRLKQYLENKRNSFDRKLQTLEKLLPNLKLLYKETELKPVIKIAEGIDAMKQMACQELDSDDTIYSFTNLENYAETFEEMGKQRSAERTKKGIKEKCLSIDGEYARNWWEKVYGKKRKEQGNTEYRWITTDKGEHPTAGEVIIFGDKVIGILSDKQDNTSFEIKSKTFANFLKILFENVWENTGNK